MTMLNAAELWNSTNSSASEKKVYYYNGAKRDDSKQGITLYNKQSTKRGISLGSGLKSTIEGYKKVSMSGQHKSKLWKFMSQSAIENRQADIDNALQIEYETQKKTSKAMIKSIKEAQAYQLQGHKKHQQALNEYYEKEALAKAEREKKKQAALSGKTYRAPPVASSSKAMSQAALQKKYKSSSSSTSSDKKAKEVRVPLNPGTKLFNTPNR